MSDFDEKDIIKSDFDEADVITDSVQEKTKPKEKATWSSMEADADTVRAAGSSAGDAALFGLGDKLIGAGLTGVDVAQTGLNKLFPNAIPKTERQINEELTAQGFGVSGPKTSKDVYYQNAEEIQAEQDRLSSENPKTALLSALVGGGATVVSAMKNAPKLASKLFAPVGEAAKTAGLGEKIARNVVNAAPITALTALESNSAKYLEGEAPKLNELADVAKFGTAVAAGIPVVGSAIKPPKAVAGKVGKFINKDAYEASVETGKYIGDEAYGQDVLNRAKGTIEEVSAPIKTERADRLNILKKQEENLANVENKLAENEERLKLALKTATAEEKIQIQQQLKAEKQQLKDAKDTIKVQIESENALIIQEKKAKLAQISEEKAAMKRQQEADKKAQTEAETIYKQQVEEEKLARKTQIKELENKRSSMEQSFKAGNMEATANDVKNMQAGLDGAFDDASARYNAFDESIDQSGVKFNFYPEVESFLNSLEPQQKASFGALANKSSVQNLDRLGFVTLRNLIDDQIRSTQDYSIKRKLRDLAGDLRKNQAETIKKQAGEEKYNELKDLNKFYSDISKLDEQFFTLDKNTSSRKTLGVLKNAEQGNEAAYLANQAFQESLQPLPPQFREKIEGPVQSRLARQTSQQQQLADLDKTVAELKELPLQTPAPQIKATDLSAQQQKIAELGKSLPQVPKTKPLIDDAISSSPEVATINGKIKALEDKIQLISANHPEALNSDAVKNAQKALKTFELEKARVIEDLKLDKTTTQARFTTGSSKFLNPDKLQNVSDVENAIKESIFNPKKDALNQTEELNQLLASHKELTGKDISERVKKIQQQAKFLDKESLDAFKFTTFDGVLSLASPGAAAAKVTLGNPGFLAKVASKAGTWNANKKTVSDASSKARSMGFSSLADKIEEINNLPETEAAQKIFLLNQNPTFRKLMENKEKK